MVVLYNTSAAAGRETYGPEFRTMDELWAAHALLGGDGADHELLRGPVGAQAAADLLDRSVPHRVPSERRAAQGHVVDVRAASSPARAEGDAVGDSGLE